MPKLDLDTVPQVNRTDYPAPFDAEVQGRWHRRLARLAGLTEMGASHVVLKPGAWSSQRHWHDDEDELVVVLAGEGVLIEDDGRTALKPGDVCAWAKGSTNGHHIVNESEADFVFVAISAGTAQGSGGYSDIDMRFAGDDYFHRHGTPYPAARIK